MIFCKLFVTFTAFNGTWNVLHHCRKIQFQRNNYLKIISVSGKSWNKRKLKIKSINLDSFFPVSFLSSLTTVTFRLGETALTILCPLALIAARLPWCLLKEQRSLRGKLPSEIRERCHLISKKIRQKKIEENIKKTFFLILRSYEYEDTSSDEGGK